VPYGDRTAVSSCCSSFHAILVQLWAFGHTTPSQALLSKLPHPFPTPEFKSHQAIRPIALIRGYLSCSHLSQECTLIPI
jgi:hypothetical protein